MISPFNLYLNLEEIIEGVPSFSMMSKYNKNWINTHTQMTNKKSSKQNIVKNSYIQEQSSL